MRFFVDMLGGSDTVNIDYQSASLIQEVLMNRIIGDGGGHEMPEIKGQFDKYDALDLIIDYRKDPSNLSCPSCQLEGTMQVLAFIEPEIDPQGCATITEPEGRYAAAIYCHVCKKSIGIIL